MEFVSLGEKCVKTGIDKQDQRFRPIDLKYLKGEIQESFEIFYKTEAFGSAKFVKFVSADPQHQEKTQKLIEEKEGTEEFFIKEEDLMKYFSQATTHLRDMIADSNISLEEKTRKIYDVSKEIMKDFLMPSSQFIPRPRFSFASCTWYETH